MADKTDKTSKKFRLSIVVLSGKELIFHFDSVVDATVEAEDIVKRGYAVEDRTADSSRINSVLYPLPQIQSMNIYEDK